LTNVEPYVLRYWEKEFDELTPQKSKAKQRVYEKKDIENILLIKQLLWKERFSIEGAQRRLKDMKREVRSQKIQAGRSIEARKLRQVKQDLKELIRFLRAN